VCIAQDQLEITRFEGTIEFDGDVKEMGWNSVPALPLITFSPEYGKKPTQFTEYKLAYNDEFLYFAGTLEDRQPDKRQVQLKRDDWKYNCDWAGIIIDSYNDKENTVVFATSPSGGRTDVSFSNDANDLQTDMNLSWNTFWEVITKSDDLGWSFEMRIPFSSLRFQDQDGKVVMGIAAWRYISNSYENFIFPDADVKHGFWGIFKASQTKEVIFNDLKSKNPIYIAPYVLGGLQQSNQLSDDESAYERKNAFTRNLGGDVKLRVSDKLTLDLTANTDFAQVEADDQMVNLTRFSLFFPEKRLFFQERRSNFEFNFDGRNRLFYTRRIGIDGGLPVDIYGGARMVGRLGPWDLGLLSMQTAPSAELFSENFSVVRLRRQILNENTYLGGILTNRFDFKGNINSAYGVDGIFRLFRDDYLKVMWAQTFTSGFQAENLVLDPTRIYLNWERRTQKGFGYNFAYSRAGEDYNPSIGYERRQNYTQYKASLLYGWVPEGKVLNSHRIELDAVQYNRNLDGSRETAELWLGWNYLTSSGGDGNIKIQLINDNLIDEFYLSEDTYISSGNYNFLNIDGEFSTPKGKKFVFNTGVNVGQFYDGWVNSISLSPKGTIMSKLEIGATYQYSSALFSDRNMHFKTHILRANSTLIFNTKLSFSAFVQYNSAINAILANARLRYNPKEGIDLYLVYNEGYNTDRYGFNPVLPVSSQRTIMVKYTHTLVF